MSSKISDKLLLLLWKNWLLNWSHKRQLFVELLLPSLLSYFFFRSIDAPLKRESVIYSEVYPINSLDLFKHYGDENQTTLHLLYSPKSHILDNLMKEAATSLNLTYSGYENSLELENKVLENKYSVGIDFDNSLANIEKLPLNLSYSIRFPRDEYEPWLTDNLFLPIKRSAPRNQLDDDGGVPVGYLRRGFLPVQNAISMAFIKLSNTEIASSLPDIFLQRFPYAEFMDSRYHNEIYNMFSYVVLISYMYSSTWLVKLIAVEKEKQLKEILKIMGLKNWLHWTAWFLQGFSTMGISVIVVVGILTFNSEISRSGTVPLFYNSSPGPLFLFFLIYTAATVTFCLMVGVFFSKANTAASVSGLIWIATIIPHTYRNTLPAAMKLLWSLICNTGMGIGLDIIFKLQIMGTGLQWNTIFLRVKPDEFLTLGHVMMIMVVSCLLNMLICLYIEQLNLGEIGVPKKWYFPFTRTFWFGEYNQLDDGYSYSLRIRKNPELFEAESIEKSIGIEIQELCKTFGKSKAVNGLSMNLYEDEITVLLGHNGAGKTTTISMLTGMLPPTSGSAIFNGCNIRTNMDGARESLGICPQHNILFDELTVEQHLIFYSCVKGLSGDSLKHEVSSYIKKLQLENKAKVASSALSGGMKRKLSVCAAFCGGSKVVLCDEPSSGMDPAARRELWDLLQAEKTGRTVLLTTHFMDEADVLGDRIAIMSAGELKCMGTQFFLKKTFGNDYLLVCVKKNTCETSNVTQLLNKYIPNIQPESEIGNELTYRLPDEYLPCFEEMFFALENHSDELSLNGYGISVTSLEEVFMKVGTEKISKTVIHENDNEVQNKAELIESLCSEHLVKGLRLNVNQWRAMIMKKFLFTIRNRMLFFLQNFLPLLLIISIWSGPIYESEEFNEVPLKFNLEQYSETVTVLETNTSSILELDISNYFKEVINDLGSNHQLLETNNKPFIEFMLKLGQSRQMEINSKFIVAATVSDDSITAWLNNEPLHSAPLTLNLIHNAIARAVIAPTASISVTNAPAPKSVPVNEETTDKLSVSAYILRDITRVTMSIVPGFIMCIVSSFYAIFIIRERESRAKLLQFVSGVKVWTFWLSHFLWDSLTLMITSVVMLLTLFYHQVDGYITFEIQARLFLLMLLFGCSALPLTYIWSFLFTEPSTGLLRLSFLNVLISFIMLVLRLTHYGPIYEMFLILNPHFSLIQGFFKLTENVYRRETCERWKTGCSKAKPFFGWEYPGVLREVVAFVVSSILYFAVLLLKDYNCFDVILNKFNDTFRKTPKLLKKSEIDEDVEEEARRVEEMSSSEISTQNLVLDKFSKFYGGFLAVNQISVAVKRSECFGLLGVNGAGKTTTFKILTGDDRIFLGKAFVKGMSLKTKKRRVDREIGYCPQFDALFHSMTGEETLRLFGLLRGIPVDRISDISIELAASLGFTDHYDKPVWALSGGNKRKLSTAVAIIGGPSVVYLDEPTTGMDPAARRKLWNLICQLRDSGKTIILTSHSMEECEALCSRLAIMVNGTFKCLGSTQHLKNRFSNGLILKIKISKHSENISLDLLEEKIQNLTKFISNAFPQAELKERFQNILTFNVPSSKTSLSRMFGLMEKNKNALSIEDYSVSQTTLEEIFLQFAKAQHDDRRNHTKKYAGIRIPCFQGNRQHQYRDETLNNLIKE